MTPTDHTSKAFAFLIGVGDYDNLINVDFAIEHAQELKEILEKEYDNVKLLLNPGYSAIIREYLEFFRQNKAKINPHSTILLYFIGHGHEIDSENYLFPKDVIKDNKHIKSLSFNINWFKATLDEIRKIDDLNVFFIIDACRDELEPTPPLSGSTPTFAKKTYPAHISYLFSCAPGKISRSFTCKKTKKTQSFFSHALLAGLREIEHKVTFQRLQMYLSRKMKELLNADGKNEKLQEIWSIPSPKAADKPLLRFAAAPIAHRLDPIAEAYLDKMIQEYKILRPKVEAIIKLPDRAFIINEWVEKRRSFIGLRETFQRFQQEWNNLVDYFAPNSPPKVYRNNTEIQQFIQTSKSQIERFPNYSFVYYQGDEIIPEEGEVLLELEQLVNTPFQQTILGRHVIHLHLPNKQLESLPSTLGKLVNLTGLSLYDNKLQSLPKSIEHLTELRLLWLTNNQFNSFPETIENLTNLMLLYLGKNQLTSLPESIGQLTNLLELDLGDNKLCSLPEIIGNLTNLMSLYLGKNQLVSLPMSIGQLTKLENLDLESNQLTFLPKPFYQLTNLQTLNLGGNQFASLPESIGNLSNLEKLYLSNNQLHSLPENIGKLTNLQILNLSDNQFKSLPESIKRLTKLQTLRLSNNPVVKSRKGQRKIIQALPKNCSIEWTS